MSNPVQTSLRRVLLCHAADWKKLYEFLSDESAEELREAAALMTDEERISRLAEINIKRAEIDVKSEGWCHSFIVELIAITLSLSLSYSLYFPHPHSFTFFFLSFSPFSLCYRLLLG